MHRLICFFIFLIALISCTVNAQFTKGTRMAGASVGSIFFNTGNSDQSVASIGNASAKVTGYGISITPSLGWFISQNTATGFAVNINPSGDKVRFEENGRTFQKDNTDNFNIGIGGFVRNYFSSSGSFLPFGQFNLNSGIRSVKKDGVFYGGTGPSAYKETYDTKSSGGFYIEGLFTVGLTKMVSQYTGLDIYAGYDFSYNKNTMKTTRLRDNLNDGTIDETLKNETTTKFTNHQFILGVGFQVFLPKKK